MTDYKTQQAWSELNQAQIKLGLDLIVSKFGLSRFGMMVLVVLI